VCVCVCVRCVGKKLNLTDVYIHTHSVYMYVSARVNCSSYLGLLTPASVACSTNVGRGLVKLIACSDIPGCWVEEWHILSVQL